jgi:hypothetical protein
MALNQSVTDAHVMVMPDMQCDSPQNKVSMTLGGETYDAALTQFAKLCDELGFIVLEKQQGATRLILVGSRQTSGQAGRRKR